jgi:hypothetical protein
VGWCLGAVALPGLGLPPRSQASQPTFEQRQVPLPTLTLDDLGATDFDGDGDLDLFTTNHLSQNALLVNDGTGAFQDELFDLGLAQTRQFPGWETLPNEPPASQPGLHIYHRYSIDGVSTLVLEVVGSGPQVSGKVEFLLPVSVVSASGASVELRRKRGHPPLHLVRFSAAEGARIELLPEQISIPIPVTLDSAYPLSQVHVGPSGASPRASTFTLYLRDRHGMAWARLKGAGGSDVFITRGGLKGEIAKLRGTVNDELMLRDSAGFQDRAGRWGVHKGGCRGRRAAALDFNADGRLDLFEACAQGSPRLWRRRGGPRFANVSEQLRRVAGRSFRWLDLDGDGRPELLAGRAGRLVVWKPSPRGRWRAHSIPVESSVAPNLLVPSDVDNDGDPDLFVASSQRSTLLLNRKDRLRPRRPASLGLPRRALTAAWVDYDNDGLTDLYTVPGGLFRQGPAGHFTRVGELEASGTRARATWADLDNDGARDLILAVRAHQADFDWQTSVLHNTGSGNHWLEFELTGRGGNRDAIGAAVSLRAQGRTETRWVGESDSSHLSQGDYRLYFGLGASSRARRVHVTWADGRSTSLHAVAADRIVQVSEPHR